MENKIDYFVGQVHSQLHALEKKEGDDVPQDIRAQLFSGVIEEIGKWSQTAECEEDSWKRISARSMVALAETLLWFSQICVAFPERIWVQVSGANGGSLETALQERYEVISAIHKRLLNITTRIANLLTCAVAGLQPATTTLERSDSIAGLEDMQKLKLRDAARCWLADAELVSDSLDECRPPKASVVGVVAAQLLAAHRRYLYVLLDVLDTGIHKRLDFYLRPRHSDDAQPPPNQISVKEIRAILERHIAALRLFPQFLELNIDGRVQQQQEPHKRDSRHESPRLQAESQPSLSQEVPERRRLQPRPQYRKQRTEQKLHQQEVEPQEQAKPFANYSVPTAPWPQTDWSPSADWPPSARLPPQTDWPPSARLPPDGCNTWSNSPWEGMPRYRADLRSGMRGRSQPPSGDDMFLPPRRFAW